MTPRVFIERPIESVEDAEALPEGTIAFDSDPRSGSPYSIAEKGVPWGDEDSGLYDPPWWIDRGQMGACDADMIGWTALVPVDATVEELPIGRRPGRRLCTAWEDL